MKHLLYFFCLPFSMGLFAQCDLPEPYTNLPTGSNLTVLLDSGFIASLNFISPNPYIVALTSANLVVGSSYLAPDSLINGMQSVAVWAQGCFGVEVFITHFRQNGSYNGNFNEEHGIANTEWAFSLISKWACTYTTSLTQSAILHLRAAEQIKCIKACLHK